MALNNRVPYVDVVWAHPHADHHYFFSLHRELTPTLALKGYEARTSSGPLLGLEITHYGRKSILLNSPSMLKWIRDDDYGTIRGYTKSAERDTVCRAAGTVTENVATPVRQAQFKRTSGVGLTANNGLQTGGQDG